MKAADKQRQLEGSHGGANVDRGYLAELDESNNVAAIPAVLPARATVVVAPSFANDKPIEPSASAQAR